MTYKNLRTQIKQRFANANAAKTFLQTSIGIDVTKDGFFKVRPEDKTPSCKINKDGSFHDFGSGEHYGDVVSLLFDGYHAFDSLPETMKWLCQELNIKWELHNG